MVRIVNHQQRNNHSSNCRRLFMTQRFSCIPLDRLIFIIIFGIGTILAFVVLLNLAIEFPQLQELEQQKGALLFNQQQARADVTTERLRGVANNNNKHANIAAVAAGISNKVSMVDKVVDKADRNSKSNSVNNEPKSKLQYPSCPYMKLSDLADAERYPKKSNVRHMVSPPIDTNVTLVCCHTTAGPWNIMVHTNWAPIGSQRFLDMVTNQYFDTTVPLMRCIPNFICQFGLNGNPTAMKPYIGKKNTLPDDPNWLPEGPKYRIDPITNRKRFQRGYLAYAGAGVHSRDVQFIVALQENGPLGGGSPWEVPWGELVGNHSYHTLSQIYTGYGENGPSQGLLYKADALTIVKEKYPLLDYIQSCYITDSA